MFQNWLILLNIYLEPLRVLGQTLELEVRLVEGEGEGVGRPPAVHHRVPHADVPHHARVARAARHPRS